MSENLPAHPSLLSGWDNLPPQEGLVQTGNAALDEGKNIPECDARQALFTPRNDIDRISDLMAQENAILCGDALETLKTLPDERFACCITSPPYWQSDYSGKYHILGAEHDPNEYVTVECHN